MLIASKSGVDRPPVRSVSRSVGPPEQRPDQVGLTSKAHAGGSRDAGATEAAPQCSARERPHEAPQQRPLARTAMTSPLYAPRFVHPDRHTPWVAAIAYESTVGA